MVSKRSYIVIAIVLVFMLSGCMNVKRMEAVVESFLAESDESIETAAASQEVATSEPHTSELSKKLPTEKEKPDLRPEKDGFGELNNVIEFYGIRMEIPSYWIFEQNEEKCIGIAEIKDNAVYVYFTIEHGDSIGGNNNLGKLQKVASVMQEKYDETGLEYTQEFYTNGSIRGYKYVLSNSEYTQDGKTYEACKECVLFVTADDDLIYLIQFITCNDSTYVYNKDIEKMLFSINSDKAAKEDVKKEEQEKAQVQKREQEQTQKKEQEQQKSAKGYEEIYEEYAKKLKEAAPKLIEEYNAEAKNNTGGIMGLASLCNQKIEKLAVIQLEGGEKMATYMYSGGSGGYNEYQEWFNKLYNVYVEESTKITEAYMSSYMGSLGF